MRQILFQIGKNFYGDFSDVTAGLWRGLLEPYAMEWYRRFKSCRTSIEDDPKSGRPSTSMDDDRVEKVLAVIRQNRRLAVREVTAEVGSSCHLILTEKRKMRRVAAKFVPRLLTRHSLSMNFDKACDDYYPPAALLSRFGPCGLFLLPEAEILTKRSPISDGRGDRRKFDTGPSRRPAKHVPGRVPEMEKNVGSGV